MFTLKPYQIQVSELRINLNKRLSYAVTSTFTAHDLNEREMKDREKEVNVSMQFKTLNNI